VAVSEAVSEAAEAVSEAAEAVSEAMTKAGKVLSRAAEATGVGLELMATEVAIDILEVQKTVQARRLEFKLKNKAILDSIRAGTSMYKNEMILVKLKSQKAILLLKLKNYNFIKGSIEALVTLADADDMVKNLDMDDYRIKEYYEPDDQALAVVPVANAAQNADLIKNYVANQIRQLETAPAEINRIIVSTSRSVQEEIQDVMNGIIRVLASLTGKPLYFSEWGRLEHDLYRVQTEAVDRLRCVQLFLLNKIHLVKLLLSSDADCIGEMNKIVLDIFIAEYSRSCRL